MTYRLTSSASAQDFNVSPEDGINLPNTYPERYTAKGKLVPQKPLSFDKYKTPARRLYRHWEFYGLLSFPKNLPKDFQDWASLFSWNLQFWEEIPISKCLSVLEVAHGCLTQGPSFAEWLKKARHFTMQANIGLGDMVIKDEYVLDNWQGYDSIFPETSLIHWEEPVEDFPYCMIPIEYSISSDLTKYFLAELNGFGPKDLKLSGTTDALRFVRASKVVNLATSKTVFVRDVIPELGKPGSGFWGRRSVIQAMPGGARDATIADPSTLVKIKLSSEIFLAICETHPNSGMCGHALQQRRIARLRTGKVFLHFDFKKIGLLLPRKLLMLLMESVGKVYNLDVSWFDFDDLFVEVEKETIATKRGYALGWMNEGVTLVIIVLIKRFLSSYGYKFDFLVFNDDVEISFKNDISEAEKQAVRYLLVQFFQKHNIYCSLKKIYFSKESIFLEDYYAPESKFDFQKRTVATRIYSKAAFTSYPFLRKTYTNIANQLWSCEAITHRIISETRREFPSSPVPESRLPFEIGGFFSFFKDGFNDFFTAWANFTPILNSINLSEKLETTKPQFAFSKKRTDFLRNQKMFRSRDNLVPSMGLPTEDLNESKVEVDEDKILSLLTTLPEDHPLRDRFPLVQQELSGIVESGIG